MQAGEGVISGIWQKASAGAETFCLKNCEL